MKEEQLTTVLFTVERLLKQKPLTKTTNDVKNFKSPFFEKNAPLIIQVLFWIFSLLLRKGLSARTANLWTWFGRTGKKNFCHCWQTERNGWLRRNYWFLFETLFGFVRSNITASNKLGGEIWRFTMVSMVHLNQPTIVKTNQRKLKKTLISLVTFEIDHDDVFFREQKQGWRWCRQSLENFKS